ncbi:hypothetical protein DSCA_11640 [Desulfosarcina alkanivorans]|uniref:Uncharacterized protein n=1 Tax=Desulfosarcina alkanivorans TaxID=571177 RepID=A0A5K7YLN2_9BACT|nr:hypothetical protein [Desulfosarcina alkanivorans]BBO67234.1 hypothetical protein DSCA_11640 [Desulfosarcina alkanivorans]
MRHFPIKTLILCILLPPLVYVFSIQQIEQTMGARYDEELAAMYTGDTRYLFDGSVTLQDVIRENVDAFLATRKLPRWGGRVNVTVKTADGVYLYPDAYDGPGSGFSGVSSIDVARENFRMLNDGLIKTVDVTVEHNTLIANCILFACVAASLLVFFLSYRRGMLRIGEEERARQGIIDSLADERRQRLVQLERLESQRDLLSEKINSMKTELDHERQKATATEDEMMDELVALEEKISETLSQQDDQVQEINALRETIKQFERDHELKNRKSLKGVDVVKKRFGTLYKKTDFHDRAIEGFVALTEEMKIKAEEVVHQLNDDPAIVQIKRKVFGRKNRETVFEVIFAYKGRLYFRKLAGNRVEVLVIGTKLTQNKDLAFLDKR